MTRRTFFIIAALVPGVFGLVMMLAPDVMLSSSLAVEATTATRTVTRWVGFAVFSIAWINFLARTDGGSPALKAIMTGNVVFHSLGIVFDVLGYSTGTMTLSGMVAGVVPHAVLAIGFVYYLSQLR
jgi:hypothetical protein